MSAWAAKRFWKDVNVVEENGGFAIRLDAREVKTPAKASLKVPTRDFGDAIAAEWRAVDSLIDPNVMPFTRSANAAIDKVSVQFEEVATMLAAYGGSDLLCYRTEGPAELIARQARIWDPVLLWAEQTFGARLAVTAGIMPIDQSDDVLQALSAPVFSATPFELTALHDLVALSGSLVLALGVTQGRLTPDEAWEISRLDEIWQAEKWGEDEDAAAMAHIKRLAFLHAADVYCMLQTDARRR